jgi:O-6-methylguanine DNA methyltransferase
MRSKHTRPPTPFERSVYAVVRRIPRGRTRSYRWVAERLGDPGLARAVGNALNRNPYAPAVPCHRVIRSDGSAGGFARGNVRKRDLLRREGVTLRKDC